MFGQEMGYDAFINAINEYLLQYQYGVTEGADLVNVLNRHSNIRLTNGRYLDFVKFADSWIRQVFTQKGAD